MPSSNLMPPALVSVDLGNSVLEAFAVIAKGHEEDAELTRREVSVPHAFVELNNGMWKQAKMSAKLNRSRSIQTHTFMLQIGKKKTYVTIGRGVMRSRDNRPLLGSNKYFAGGVDALLCAILSEVFPKSEYPKGHNNILLSYGIPPTEWQQVDTLDDFLFRRHKIEDPDGKKRSFYIRKAVSYDESVAGLIYAVSTDGERRGGKFTEKKFKASNRVLILDAGGRLGSMGWATIDNDGFPIVDYGGFKPIDGGSITIREDVRGALKAMYPKELRGMTDTDMDDEWIDDIIRNKRMILNGNVDDPIDVTDTVNSALGYIALVRDRYKNDFGSGRQASHVLLTGGTIAQIYDDLCDELNHNSIVTAADLKNIWYANVRGGLLILVSALRDINLFPAVFKKNFYLGE